MSRTRNLTQRQMDSGSKPDPEEAKIGRFGQNPRKSSMRTRGKSAEVTVLKLQLSVFAKRVNFQVLTAAEHVAVCLCASA